MPTIMIRHATDEDIQQAKDLTGQHGSAAKALVTAASMGARYKARYESECADNQRLREQLRVMQQTLDGARNAAKALVERCGQGDLLNG